MKLNKKIEKQILCYEYNQIIHTLFVYSNMEFIQETSTSTSTDMNTNTSTSNENVLELNKVRIISYSSNPYNPNENLEHMIAYCARVSNPANQSIANTTSDSKLIKYLIKNLHWSPFEMVSICLEINTTRDISRQILRHRSFSFQEFSQRYANPLSTNSSISFEIREARLQDKVNRQNSLETSDHDLKTQWELIQQDIIQKTTEAYSWAIANGIAKEQARVVLPEGNMGTKLYVNGTVRSWIHYIQLRASNGTQKEHREIALQCAKAIEPIFPLIMDFVPE